MLALFLVYLVMASLFESLAQPFAILFSILFAFPGAIWALGLTGTPFNLMAQIGLLILMGIVVNNGIVLLDHVNRLRQSGMSKEESILRVSRNEIIVNASTDLREVNHVFNVSLPQLEHRSLNGLLLEEFGHVPEAGESLALVGVHLEVIEASDTQVLKVRLTRIGSTTDAESV